MKVIHLWMPKMISSEISFNDPSRLSSISVSFLKLFEIEVKLYQNCSFQFPYWNCIWTVLKLKHQKIEIYGNIKFIYLN